MMNSQKLLKWGHDNLKIPYFRLAEEITAAGQRDPTSKDVKLLFFPFKTDGSVVADVTNHFYPPVMDSPVVNAVMLVTESTKKGIIRILTEEYDIGTLNEDPAESASTMYIKDWKPTRSKIDKVEKLMLAQNYQGILDYMEEERGTSWNCLKIGSMKMLEEMKLIEKVSNKTGDFLTFLFQTLDSLQRLYSTGDFYVYPEERFPIFYFWHNFFSNWTRSIDYQGLKLFISQLFKNRKLNFIMTARERTLFNLLVNIENGKIFMEMVPPLDPSQSKSSSNKVVHRRWNSVKSVEMVRTLMKSQSFKELFLNFIPYIATFAIPQQRKNKDTQPKEKKQKKSGLGGFITPEVLENIIRDFTGDLNDGDRVWTLVLEDEGRNTTPLLGFESEIQDGFFAHITGLRGNELKAALDKEIPFKNIKMRIFLNQNYLKGLESQLAGLDLPKRLKIIENLFLQGMKTEPESNFIKTMKSKGLLSTLYRSISKKKKKSN